MAALKADGWREVGTLVEFVTIDSGEDSEDVWMASAEDGEAIFVTALEAGTGRFHLDPEITESDARMLAIKNINRALDGGHTFFCTGGDSDDPLDVGHISVFYSGGVMRVGSFAVFPTARGRGLGSRLIETAKLMSHKIRRPLKAGTYSQNVRACRFYEAHGFTEADRFVTLHK